LAKALGNRKAQAVLDRIISISGFLQLQTMTPEQVCDVLSDEPPETIASALSQLDASHAIQVFNGLNTEVQNHIAKQMATQTPLSEDERRQLDHRLADKHLTL
jgi:flagellar motor switch protein FliG